MLKLATTVLGTAVGLIVLVAAGVAGIVSALFGGGDSANASQPSHAALADIPSNYLALYQQAAATCPGLDWSILAAIGKIETNHGRLNAPGVHSGENFAGAGGPMQFLQPTFDSVVARHPIPPGGSTPPSRYNPHDAIYAAAFYLCGNGARDGRDLYGAIFAYNHADWYVSQVLNQATQYKQAARNSGTDTAASPQAQQAVNYAQGQLGLPYVWGGNGPDHGHTGFDCSGLTKAAYEAAGINLPRTAQTQYDAVPLLPKEAPLAPGDLVFYGTPGNIHHVGLYIGAGKMIHAPDFGQPVQVGNIHWPGDDYAGATRPAR
ncbi:hydrolase Nlp/P60 [Longimycelium tulufanense]|uniref:Hydrolase Nlp/P60 n=1 Tax=Longimycelium tulufanense TaxID=907463 RepID=A0A8J3CL42_9PSEU|nr:bifunctional lytic transglycosylase/C40 family peptidase [Longimycelium tulufanense]GGM80950.1 hydrolase Nlp/P60 [Longimycelium tulufanense]